MSKERLLDALLDNSFQSALSFIFGIFQFIRFKIFSDPDPICIA